MGKLFGIFYLLYSLLCTELLASEAETKTEEKPKNSKESKYEDTRSISIPLIIIPAIKGSRIEAYVFLKAVIVIAPDIKYIVARAKVPILYDRLFFQLYDAFHRFWIPPKSPSWETVKGKMFTIIKKTFGADAVEKIYLRQYFFHNTRVDQQPS